MSVLGPGPNAPGNAPRLATWDAIGPLSWSSPNNQGATKEIQPGQTNIGVADLRAPSWVIGTTIGVVLGAQPQGDEDDFLDLASFLHSNIRATIVWNVGSAAFRAQCDWMNGTQIAVQAAQVQVYADYILRGFPNEPDPLCGDFPNVNLAAAFTYGGIGRSSNPARLTELVQIADSGGVSRIRVPPFATSFNVQIVRPQTSAQIDVLSYGALYRVRHNITAPLANVGQDNHESAFPLRNGARFLEVTNTNQSGPLMAFVVFGLAI